MGVVEPATPLEDAVATSLTLDGNLTLRRGFYRHNEQEAVAAATASILNDLPDDGVRHADTPWVGSLRRALN